MKFGHYAIDVNGVSNTTPKVKFLAQAITSHAHKHARNCGREVWHFGPFSGWKYSPQFGVFETKEKPQILQMLELAGAL